MLFHMVTSNRGGGSGSGLGSGDEPIDERIHEFVIIEITHDILEATPVMFGSIKEGIMELLDKYIGAFRANIAAG